MKKLMVMLLISCVSFAAFAGGQSDDTIKIGVAGAHTGDLASYGLSAKKGVEMVVEMYNANGGVNGKMVELISEDDVCKPEVATNTAAKLVGDEVVAVIGHICSGATNAALGVYEGEGIVTISPSATTPSLTKSGDYSVFFRTIAPDDAQADTIVNYALGTLGKKKIAILHDKGDYGKGLAEMVQERVEAASGAEVTLFEGIQAGAVDYSAIINKIANEGADAIVFGGYHPEASKLVSQMKKKNLDIPFLSDDGVKDNTFIKVAGEDAEGVYATGPVDTSSNPMTIKALADQEAKYQEEPGAFFLNAYAATIALLNAIEVADSTEKDDIMAALKSEYVDTPLGKISFDDRGDAIGVGFAVYQVQNGEYVELK